MLRCCWSISLLSDAALLVVSGEGLGGNSFSVSLHGSDGALASLFLEMTNRVAGLGTLSRALSSYSMVGPDRGALQGTLSRIVINESQFRRLSSWLGWSVGVPLLGRDRAGRRTQDAVRSIVVFIPG